MTYSELLIFGTFFIFIGFLVVIMVLRRRSSSLYRDSISSTRRELILEGTIGSLSREKQNLQDKHSEVKGRVREISQLNEYILKSIDYVVISTNLENQIKTVNPYFTKCFQVSISEVYGKPLEIFFQKQNELLEKLSELTQKKTISSFRMEIAHRRKNLVMQWFDLSATRLKDNYNNEIGHVFLLRDITKFKNLEAQLVLKKEMEALGEMSATLAHEFRNALNPIKGNARLLSKLAPTPEIHETVDDINNSIEQLNKLVDHLLMYAKNQPIKFSKVDLKEMLDHASYIAKKVLSEKEIFVAIKYQGDSFFVEGDSVTLQQAFSNLLINAADAVEEKTGKVQIEVSCNPPYHQLLFKDNGLGIPQEIQEKIFRPFFTTKAQGSGLGLALTHKIILAHNGTITVNCPPEGGTQFLIQLPISSH